MSMPSDTRRSDAAGGAGREPARRALVVIADAELRKEIRQSAREAGLALADAGSVEEALANWGDGVGVVLLDASLVDGARPLLDRAREAGAPVRVAGRADQVDEVLQLLKSGARGFVALPQPAKAVVDELGGALAREEQRHLEDTPIGRAKKELQAAFDTFPSTLLVVGPDLRVRRGNRAALDLWGRGSLLKLEGADACDVLGSFSAASRRRLAEAVRSDRRAEFDLDIPLDSAAGGSSRVYHVRVFPAEAGKKEPRPRVFPDGGGKAESRGLGDGALVLIEDVTLSRRAEAEHAHEQQLEAVTLLASTLSHEINQPLGTILGRAQLSLMSLEQEGFEKAPLKRDLEEVVQCVRRVSDILEKLHRITEIVRKPYLGDTEILDLDRSAR